MSVAATPVLEVRDLESTNGTFINGQRIDVAHLAPGDRLQVGRMELVALRDAGMDPDRDVTLVATGGLNAHLPALQAGRVDMSRRNIRIS